MSKGHATDKPNHLNSYIRFFRYKLENKNSVWFFVCG